MVYHQKKKALKVVDVARGLMILLNGLYWAASAGMIGYVVYYLSTQAFTLIILLGSRVIVYCLLVLLSLLYITGMLGYMGAVLRHKYLIRIYMIGVCVCFVITLAYAITAQVYQPTILDLLGTEDDWDDLQDSDVQKLQLENSCCGYNAVAAGSGDEFDESCYLITDNGANSITYEIHTIGCYERIQKNGYDIHAHLYAGILSVAVTLEVLGFLGSIYMNWKLKSQD